MCSNLFKSLFGLSLFLVMSIISKFELKAQIDTSGTYFSLNSFLYKENCVDTIIFIINEIVYNKDVTQINSLKDIDSLAHIRKYQCKIEQFPKGNKDLADKFLIDSNRYIVMISTTKKLQKSRNFRRISLRRAYFNTIFRFKYRNQVSKK